MRIQICRQKDSKQTKRKFPNRQKHSVQIQIKLREIDSKVEESSEKSVKKNLLKAPRQKWLKMKDVTRQKGQILTQSRAKMQVLQSQKPGNLTEIPVKNSLKSKIVTSQKWKSA